jgi:tetratricopeptide (TPR) repeat protein/tRNA A-37 threonylcarbamoyl transferase component Bud32
MGVVYKARQVKLNRIVALKMVLAGVHASPEDLRRFQTEAEAVARLQHPNIVQVFDHGERDGRPYFSLEFCAGGSLQSRLDGTPMSPVSAARLLRSLAEAVHYAHQQGVVHRDMKPANVLIVEPKGTALETCTPKITDFGLAKMLDDEGHTATEAVLGTPTYMAPEQAQGKTKQVGPAADIYSLGAILYDLLVGRPPFKGATVMDTIQMVQTAEPVPPTRLQPGIPVDLQTITLKCLEKSPERRYANAADLADDLQRFLRGEPIKARPVSTWEHAWKWVARNPAWAALIALSFLTPLTIAALLGYGTVLLQAKVKEITEAKQDADEAKEDAELKRLRAENAERETRTAFLEMEKAKKREEAAKLVAQAAKNKVVEAQDQLQESFRGAQVATERMLRLAQSRLRYLGGTEAVRRELLDEALRMSLSFTKQQGDSLANLRRVAHAHRLVGELEGQIGNHDRAVQHFTKALTAIETILTRDEKSRLNASLHNERVEVLLQRWAAEQAITPGRSTGSLDEAISRFSEMPRQVREDWATERSWAAVLAVKAIHEQGRGPLFYDDARKNLSLALNALKKLEKRPEVAGNEKRLDGVRLEHARTLCNLSALNAALSSRAWGEADRRRYLDDALSEADASLTMLRDLRKRSSAVDILSELGRAMGNKGSVLLARGERKKAGEAFDEAVDEFRQVRKLAELNADYRHLLAVALLNQGLGRYHLNQGATALNSLREAGGLLADLVRDFPAASLYKHDAARVALSKGQLLLTAGKPASALPYFRDALAGFRKAAKMRNVPEGTEAKYAWLGLMRSHHLLANAADAAGDTEAALDHLGHLSEMRRQRFEALPLIKDDWWRALEHSLAGTELLLTESVRARFLEKARDHRALSASVAEMARLLPTWPYHVENLAHLATCVRLADKEADAKLKARLKDRYGEQAAKLLKGLSARPPAGLAASLKSPALAALREVPAAAKAFAEFFEKR